MKKSIIQTIALFILTAGCLSASISTTPETLSSPASNSNEGIVKINDKELLARLLKQVQYEYESSYLYEARSQYAKNENLPGAAKWFAMQAAEERMHADKILNHLRNAGITNFSLPALKSVPVKFASILEAFESSLVREKELSRLIEGTANLAAKNKEHYTSRLMKWFIDEQIEEETMFDDTIAKIKWYLKMNNYPGMDDYLAKRIN